MTGLQILDQARLPYHLGVQPLGGQKQYRKVGGARRVEVLVGDIGRRFLHHPHQRLARLGHALGIGTIGSVDQAQVVLLGKL